MHCRLSGRLLVVGTALLVLAGLAHASEAAPEPHLSLAPAVGPPTSETRVLGTGFASREVIDLFFDDLRLGTDTANPRGKFTFQLVVPVSATPGDHVIVARGTASGLSAIAEFLVQTDWAQFHFDGSRSGFNPFENVLDPGSVSGIIIHSRIATPGPIVGSPVYCGGSAFVGSSAGTVSAVEPPEPDFRWTFPTGGSVEGSIAAIPPGPCTVLVGSTDGTFTALDGATGRPEWSVDLGAPILAAAVIHGFDPQPDPPGRIFVGDTAGVLHALDADGNQVWATALDGPILGAPSFLSSPSAPSTLQLDPGNRIFVGTGAGTLYSVDPSDGSVAFALPLDSPIVAAPVITRGSQLRPQPPQVVVGTTGGTLYALFADDGTLVGSFRTGGSIVASAAIGDPNVIGDPNLIGDPGIFVASEDGVVSAFADTEHLLDPVWTSDLGTPIATSPALADGVLYLGAGDSRLHAIEALTGREIFRSSEITDRRSSPIVADGMVAVGTMDGDLVTFGPA